MQTRELTTSDIDAYERLAEHPLQSWAWGDFRTASGIRAIRVGISDGQKLSRVCQMTLHPLPLGFHVGYVPKGPYPEAQLLNSLAQIGRRYKCIFIQLEPNVPVTSPSLPLLEMRMKQNIILVPSARPLFTKYTFHIDLARPEADLFAHMHPKTRYNVRLAQKRGVIIQEESTPEAFQIYLKLTHETTKRQGFYAHSDAYHQLMWNTLSKKGIAHLLTARYHEEILVTWIVFLYKNTLYYPYGASTASHKEVMASNLMMWEAIKWGKAHNAKLFDLWGTPGPNPSPSDSYFGFHRFKMGYDPKLVEFIGSYDFVLQPVLYRIFTAANRLRWIYLTLKARVFDQDKTR